MQTQILENIEKNEDYLYAEGNLFVVADGMGGHRAGEVASRFAVETFIKDFNCNLVNIIKKTLPDKKNNSLTSHQIRELLTASIKNTNREVFKRAVSQPEYYGMGTTLTGCYIQKL